MRLADDLFKRHRFERLIMVRWYVSYKLSYRDLVERMAERGLSMAHTTIMRWALRFVPVFEQHWRKYARSVGRSWRVDETYIKVKGRWVYLYRAVSKAGQTVDFYLSEHRDVKAAKRFGNAATVITGIDLAQKIRKGRFKVHRLVKRALGDVHDLWMAVLVE